MSNNQPPRRGVEYSKSRVPYSVLGGIRKNGETTHVNAECPFCKRVTLVHTWSLARQGKKCNCGAKFFSDGTAERRM